MNPGHPAGIQTLRPPSLTTTLTKIDQSIGRSKHFLHPLDVSVVHFKRVKEIMTPPPNIARAGPNPRSRKLDSRANGDSLP